MLALSAWTRPAAACGACLCDSGSEPVPIRNLIRDVPLNLSVPVRAASDPEAAPFLERVSDGLIVPVVRTGGDDGYWWLSSEHDLEPNTEYRIVSGGTVVQFTTGASPDYQSPSLQGFSVIPGGNGALCEPSVGARLTLLGAADGATFNVWVEVQVIVQFGAWTTLRIPYDQNIGLGHSISGCLGATELPELVGGTTYPSRLRLHDAAGNASEWQTFNLEVMAEEPGGCGMPEPTAGTSSMPGGGSGAADAGGTDAGLESGGAGDALEGNVPPRTSKGCGCSFAQRGLGAWAGYLLFSSLLVAAGRRRRSV